MGAPSVAYCKQFGDTIAMLPQQMASNTRSTVMVDTDFKGEEKYYDQYSTDDMVEIVQRFAPTPVQAGNHERRRVTPRFFVSNTVKDPVDALQMKIDPSSAYMIAKRAAAGRKEDDLTITALGGTAYAGKAGGTETTLASYDSSSHTIASGSTGMTTLKFIKAKRLLDKAEVAKEDRTALLSANALADMLNSTEPGSIEFNIVKSLVEGTLARWLGFNIVQSERLTTNTSDERLLYAYQKQSMQLAIQQDVEGRVSERADMNYAWQYFIKMCMGATRLNEEGVVQIAVIETQWA